MKPENAEAFLAHASFVRGLARSLVSDPGAVEDVVQETWIRSVQSPPPRSGSVRAWLATVARNLVRKSVRGETRRAERERATARREPVDSAQSTVEREAVIKRIVDEVFRLDEPYRTSITLRYYEDLTLPEIARRMDVPLETVRTRLRRAHARLRRRLDRDFGDRRDWCLALGPVAGVAFVGEAAAVDSAAGAAASTVVGAAGEASGATTAWGALATAWKLLAATAWVALLGFLVVRLVPGGGRAPDPGVRSGAVPSPLAPGPGEGARDPDANPATAVRDRAPADPERARPSAADRATGTVLVRVRFADGSPAAGVRVALVGPGAVFLLGDDMVHVTDAEGVVRVELPPGGRAFSVDRAPVFREIQVESGSVTLVEQDLPPGLRVSGRVVDAEGSPVRGATVLFARRDFDPGVPLATTDARGRFSIRDLSAPGFLGAFARGHAPPWWREIPGKTTGSREVELALRGPGGELDVQVLGADAVPLPGAEVYLGARDARPIREEEETGARVMVPPRRHATSDAGGGVRFEGIAPGPVRVAVVTEGYAAWHDSVDIAAPGSRSLTVRLDEGAVVSGVVRTDSGDPVAGAQIAAQAEALADLAVQVVTESGDDGSYRLARVPSGRVTLMLLSDESGGAETTLDVASGARVAWDPVLESRAAFRVRVLHGDDTPAPGWHVFVETAAEEWIPGYRIGVHHQRVWYRHGVTDEDGRAEIRGCVARPHRLRVAAPATPAMAGPPSVVREGRLPGDDLQIRLDESASGWIEGRLEIRGEPAGDPVLFVREEGQLGPASVVHPEQSGAFRIGPLVPGSYWVTYAARSYEQVLGRFELDPEERLDLGERTVGETGRLEVRLDPDEGVAPEDPDLALRDPTGSSRWGGFTFDGRTAIHPSLPPGSYRLALRGAGIASALVPVDIRAGETTRLAVPVQAGVRRDLVIVEPDGLSWARVAELVVRDSRGAEVLAFWTRRDEEGCFAQAVSLAPGEYTVQARTDEETHGTQAFLVEEEPETARVEILVR